MTPHVENRIAASDGIEYRTGRDACPHYCHIKQTAILRSDLTAAENNPFIAGQFF